MDNNFMNEFGGEENADALNVLIEEVTGEATPIEEVPAEIPPEVAAQLAEEGIPPEEIPPELVPEEIIPEVPPTEVDPTAAPQAQMSPETQAILLQMQQQNDNIANMQEQMKAQPQPEQIAPELTEEEEAMIELRKRLGVDKMEEENAALKQQMEDQQAQLQQTQQAKQAVELSNNVLAFKEGKDTSAQEIVEKELTRIASTNPEQASALDNPEGWNMIYHAFKSQNVNAPTPDPIVPATAGNVVTPKSTTERIKESTNNVEIGEALLDLMQTQ